MRESAFPASEKCARVTPVYKSGEKRVMDNYRPYRYCQYFQRCLSEWCFRQRSSTQHAVIILTHSIRQNIDKGLMTRAVFLD